MSRIHTPANQLEELIAQLSQAAHHQTFLTRENRELRLKSQRQDMQIRQLEEELSRHKKS